MAFLRPLRSTNFVTRDIYVKLDFCLIPTDEAEFSAPELSQRREEAAFESAASPATLTSSGSATLALF